LLTLILGIVTFRVFGQPEIPMPGDVSEVLNFLYSYLAVAGLTMFCSEALFLRVPWFSEGKVKLRKSVVVFAIALAWSFISGVLNIGYLADAIWWEIMLWGALSGGIAAGFWSTNFLFVKSLIEWLVSFIKSKQTI